MTPISFMLALFSTIFRWLERFRVRALKLISSDNPVSFGIVPQKTVLPRLFEQWPANINEIGHIFIEGGFADYYKRLVNGFVARFSRTERCHSTDISDYGTGLQFPPRPVRDYQCPVILNATAEIKFIYGHNRESASARARRQAPSVPGLFSKAPTTKNLEIILCS